MLHNTNRQAAHQLWCSAGSSAT